MSAPPRPAKAPSAGGLGSGAPGHGALQGAFSEYLRRPHRYFALTNLPQAPLVALVALALGPAAVADPAAAVLAEWRGGLPGLLLRALLAYGVLCLFSFAFVAGTGAVAVDLAARLAPELRRGASVWWLVGQRLWPLLGSMVLGCLIVLALLALVALLVLGPLLLFARAASDGDAAAVQRVLHLVEVFRAWASRPESRLYLAAVLLFVSLYLVRALVRWALAPQVAVLEGGSPERVLWRSSALVQGAWWRTLGLLVGLLAIQALLSNLFAALAMLLARPFLSGAPAAAVFGLLGNLLFLPLPALGTSLLYFELRERSGATRSAGPGSVPE